jgi:hypothetical protein
MPQNILQIRLQFFFLTTLSRQLDQTKANNPFLCLIQMQTTTNYYKTSFFPRTIFHWYAFPTCYHHGPGLYRKQDWSFTHPPCFYFKHLSNCFTFVIIKDPGRVLTKWKTDSPIDRGINYCLNYFTFRKILVYFCHIWLSWCMLAQLEACIFNTFFSQTHISQTCVTNMYQKPSNFLCDLFKTISINL